MKKAISIIVTSFFLGGVVGAIQCWPELTTKREQSGISSLNTVVDEKVLAATPNLDQILAIHIPKPSDDIAVWKTFLTNLESIELGKRESTWDRTSSLMAFYAYVAKHKPEIFYQRMSKSMRSRSLISDLIRLRLLPQWHTQVENSERWLLADTNFVKSAVIEYGIDNAKRMTANAFLLPQQSPINVALNNLRFASQAMTTLELEQVVQRLLRGDFKYDPREVELLMDLPSISQKELVQLIRGEAYPSKSMSSYMATATRLGATDYVKTLARDAGTNAGQPTNFYCSGCALSLYTEGLIGQPLVTAAFNERLSVNKEDGQLVLSLAPHSLSAGASQ